MSPQALLEENEALRGQVAERDARLRECDVQLRERDAQIATLEQELVTLAKQHALTAKERDHLAKVIEKLHALRTRRPTIAPGQGVLGFLDEPVEEKPQHVDEAPDGETKDDRIRGRHKPKKPARKLDTSNLPVEHVQHELPEDERICPVTGALLVPVGEELEEEVVYRPSELKVVVHHRQVYGLSQVDAKERQAPRITAPAPQKPIEGSPVGATLLAWILVQKYLHHLPLYRQEQIFGRAGLRIPRQTMCDWVLFAATLLQPIQEALRRLILAQPVVQLDDTPVKCQAGKGHGIFEARLWTLVSPEVEGVLYDFTERRSAECILEILPGFEEGVLVGDGYVGYQSFVKARPGVENAGCWAHALRKFRDALDEAPLEALRAKTTIKELFVIEQKADEGKLSCDQRLALRKSESAKVVDDLDELLAGWRGRYSEPGKMGTACKYIENQATTLRAFLKDGRVPIHNNACEVSIRPVAVGRKNWLFAGSVRGGLAAATIYTLVESCKKASVNPYDYLADVLLRVATHPASRVDELLPANWKRLVARPAAERN
jgi:transposase